MGEKLQWAVKNGDLDAVKALVEQVRSYTKPLYRLLAV